MCFNVLYNTIHPMYIEMKYKKIVMYPISADLQANWQHLLLIVSKVQSLFIACHSILMGTMHLKCTKVSKVAQGNYAQGSKTNQPFSDHPSTQ